MYPRHKSSNGRITIACVTQFFVAFGCAFLQNAHAHIARDLVLTPKQGLQLHGKSIFYEDNGKEYLHNNTIRPWERTLKHVTFVTLFSDVATAAVTRNSSEQQQYAQFLQAPYISQATNTNARFGDIVNLANGWLEHYLLNNSHAYRFIEGHCDQVCITKNDNLVALWQVQKIRHRDQGQRRFRYEMKFNISPLVRNLPETINNDESNLVKRKTKYEAAASTQQRNYIQKEDDYPHNFGRIIYPDEELFADRQIETNNRSPQYFANNPLATTTNFLGSLLLPPPPTATRAPSVTATTDELNIGEYIRDSYNRPITLADRGQSKIELYPNAYNRLQSRPLASMFTETSYQPNFQLKLPPFNVHSASGLLTETKQPVIAHHYHHHYYMPSGSSSLENELSSAEHLTLAETDSDVSYLHNQRLDERHTQLPLPPAPQKFSTSRPPAAYNGFSADVEKQQLVQLQPVTQLRNSNYQLYPINFSNNTPFFFYPNIADNAKEKASNIKPFRQSEPILEENIRYSEPDPLYEQLDETITNYEANKSQLEKPKIEANEWQEENSTEISYIDMENKHQYINKTDLEQISSFKNLQLSAAQTTTTTVATTTASNTLGTTISTTTSTTPNFSTTTLSTLQRPVVKSTRSSNFVSTSTTEHGLHAASRYRNGYSRYRQTTASTTERPVLKWQPKRKNNNISTTTEASTSNDVKAGRFKKMLLPTFLPLPLSDSGTTAKVIEITVNSTTQQDSPATTTVPGILSQNLNENYEVLTQKSVSKSITVKIGENGEELPVVFNEHENEVSRE